MRVQSEEGSDQDEAADSEEGSDGEEELEDEYDSQVRISRISHRGRYTLLRRAPGETARNPEPLTRSGLVHRRRRGRAGRSGGQEAAAERERVVARRELGWVEQWSGPRGAGELVAAWRCPPRQVAGPA